MMEKSQDIISCYPVNSCCWISCDEGIHVWWEKGPIMKIKEFKILFIGIVYKVTLKAMKKKAFIPLLCLQVPFSLEDETKRVICN